MGALVLVGLAAFARAATVQGGALWVAFPAQAESCSYEQLSIALRARLGEVDIRRGVHAAEGHDVSVVLQRDGRDWELLVRAAGALELRRKLPEAGTDCVELSETAALMIERYLDDIRWTGGRAELQPLATTAPTPPPPHWQVVLEFGGGVGVNSLGLAPATTVDVGMRKGPWQFEVSGELQGRVQTTVVVDGVLETGTVTAQGSLQLSAGYLVATGFGAVSLELAPGAEFFGSSTSTGTPPQYEVALTAVPFLGLRVGYEFPLGKQFFLSLRVEVRAHPNVDFVVTGTPSYTVSAGNFDGYGVVGLGYVFH